TVPTALGPLVIWGTPILNAGGSPITDANGTVLKDTLLRQVNNTFFTWWAKETYFTCYDIGDTVKVELLAVDGLGTVESYYNRKANGNIAWGVVVPEDKTPPSCKPPVSLTIPCTDPRVRYEDAFTCADSVLLEELFGAFTTEDNCGAQMVCVDVKDTRNNCGTGFIIRSYRAEDSNGKSSGICTQTITVTPVHDYIIGFPSDKTGACAQVLDTCIYIQENACDLLAISVKDLKFEASGDECYKIERTFKVINWCEYDGVSDPYVVSRDVDGDGNPGDEDIWVIRRPSRVFLDRAGAASANWVQDLCAKSVNLPSETDANPSANTEGKLTPPTDEFPEAPWNGTNPRGAWDWADVFSFSNGGTNDDSSSDDDKIYAPGQRARTPGNLTNYSTGYWQYTQYIKVYDDVDPVVTFTEQTFCSYASDVQNNCPAPADVIFNITEECTPDNLSIKVFLDAFSNGVIDADNTLPNNALKANFGATVTYVDSTGVVTIKGGAYPLGEHLFEVHVVDGCGNATVARIPFTMLDCKAPSPICINGLAVELMPVIPNADVDGDGDTDTGAFVVWAKDFLASSQPADCSDPVKYALYRADDPRLADSTFVPDTAHTFVTLTCGDFSTQTDSVRGPGGAVLVRVYAIETPRSAQDSIHNFDYCETYVLVQNNLNTACTSDLNPGVIAGVIKTEENKTVKGVTVQLSGQSSQLVTTSNPGKYGFANLQENYDYTVTPLKDKDFLNGVSTFDLVLISKHILGVQVLGSPYKLIAADVNNSKSITTLDLIQLRKVILGISTEFSNNTSWRFVAENYAFPVPTNPWTEPFPEITSINDLQGAMNDVNFVAIKVGDVNANAVANSLDEVEVRDRKQTFFFEVENQSLKAGNEYRVAFRVGDLAKIQGYQGALTFDAQVLELVDIEGGIANTDNFGLRFVKEGIITTSWNVPGAAAIAEKDAVLFTLVFRTRKNAELSNLLSVSSYYTAAEAYDQEGELLNVGIQFSNGVIAGGEFALLQNVPNPFKGRTEIGFHLPFAGDATLTLTDMTGKTIKQIRGNYVKGFNQILLNAAELPSGVLFYTLQSGPYIATRQMIIIK
ncbi:MAG: cohesin domain-containing protein, partial [Saprospiraceae bacterium]